MDKETMDAQSIPFNKPAYLPAEKGYIEEVLEKGHPLGGWGFHQEMQHAVREPSLVFQKRCCTTSCTHALELSAILLDIKPGDEVIIPSFTFVSTVNAFVLRGAKPVFIDIRPDDPSTLMKVNWSL